MEEKIFCDDEEENRHAKHYKRWTKESRYESEEREGGFADSFDAIWEGRS